jgi:hypothetical protein
MSSDPIALMVQEPQHEVGFVGGIPPELRATAQGFSGYPYRPKPLLLRLRE